MRAHRIRSSSCAVRELNIKAGSCRAKSVTHVHVVIGLRPVLTMPAITVKPRPWVGNSPLELAAQISERARP